LVALLAAELVPMKVSPKVGSSVGMKVWKKIDSWDCNLVDWKVFWMAAHLVGRMADSWTAWMIYLKIASSVLQKVE